MIRALALAAILAATAGAAGAAESRFTRLDRCVEVPPEASEDQGGDFLLKRCDGQGAHHVWLLYLEGTRLRLGFGAKGSAAGMFDAERNAAWPVEWRGQVAGGRFTPYAAILRVRDPGETAQQLVVFKLRDDGASCIVGRVAPGSRQNARAQAIADARGECESEPDVF